MSLGLKDIWQPQLKNPDVYRKTEASSLIPIILLNFCNIILFAGMALILLRSQVHCSGIM